VATLIAGERGPDFGLNWLNPGDFGTAGFDIGFIWHTTWQQAPTATFARGDLRSIGLPNVVYEFYGSGFTYDMGGVPTGGTLTRLVALDSGVTIFDLRDFSLPMADFVSLVEQAETGNKALANNTFKGAVLAGADTLAGSSGPDVLSGWGGNDAVRGNGGDDVLIGAGGRDQIDGGTGSDTAMYWAFPGDYYFVNYAGTTAVIPKSLSSPAGTDGIDKVTGVENIYFAQTRDLTTGVTRPTAGLVNEVFSPSEYLASYPDLSAAFGTSNPSAAFDHYVYNGYHEGRRVSFNGLEYIASYGDLANAFGANVDAGASHYITNGRLEGRTTSFNGLEYIASYADLIGAFGVNEDAGASHYIANGRFEGRSTSFDGLQYIASYGDLVSAFGGSNFRGMGAAEDSGAGHFIGNGFGEGRARDTFDAAQYLANYADLQAAFGTDAQAATVHYVTNGYFEGRTDNAV
jgi:hypothetical protein